MCQRIAILFILQIAAALTVAGATDIPPGPVSGIWPASGSPYNVLGDITIPAGETLIIEPGCVVDIQGAFEITAEGTLQALGTAIDSIWIAGAVLWEGIRLENEIETSGFAYCRIDGADKGIHSINAPVTLTNCRLSGHVTAIDIYGIGAPSPAEVLILSCVIQDCQRHGVFIVENSNVTISGCEITRCALDNSPRGAIQLSNQSPAGQNDPLITGNWIHHNVWQGMTAFDITGGDHIHPMVTNNVIEYNLTGIYLLYASGTFRDNRISHNFQAGNPNSGAGVMVSGVSAHPVFTGNELTGNFTAFYIVEGATANLGDLGNAGPEDDGGNYMHDNVDLNNITWSVYNFSAADVKAENNSWDSDDYGEIALTIYDFNDNGACGLVDFDPIRPLAGLEGEGGSSGIVLGSVPNPFHQVTCLQLRIPESAQRRLQRLEIFGPDGRMVRAISGLPERPGLWEVPWDGRDECGRQVPAGSYYGRLVTARGQAAFHRLILLR